MQALSMGLLRRVASLLASVKRYFKGVLGEDSYEKYLDHHQSTGCATPPMTVREFWRDKMDRQDASPEGRCC